MAEERDQAVLAVISDGETVTDVAARFGMSRQSVHTWLAKYEAGGLEGLADGSHRPRSCPHQVGAEVEVAIVDLRRQHPGWGPRRLVFELGRRGIVPVPSESAVYRALSRLNLIDPGASRRRDRRWKRWERGKPMELWQMDTVGGFLIADGTKAKALTGVDDHSRFCVSAYLMPRESSQRVVAGLLAAMQRYGIPEQILTDNGKVFVGRSGPAEQFAPRTAATVVVFDGRVIPHPLWRAMDSTQILERGYLPEALPLAFTSASFAAASSNLKRADDPAVKKEWAEVVTVNVARPGGLRRRMAIVNPFKQRLLSAECSKEWGALTSHLAKSHVSVTKPTPLSGRRPNDRGVRYLQHELPRGDRAASRSALLGGTRYTLQADISNFYGSVYTHSIDWALTTKRVAKANARSKTGSLGSRIDKLVRDGQDGQTKGIPVGPDTSHLLAEVLLCELDSMLEADCPQVKMRGMRFVDDFDFAARTYSEAEAVLRSWDSILASFEFTLNPLKTRIIEGAVAPEPAWKIQLRQHPLRETRERELANDLRSLFSLAIETSTSMPGTPALTYAVRRVAELATSGGAWTELQNLLLGAVTIEPSCLPRVYELMARAIRRGQAANLTRFEEVLNELAAHHALLEHGSEVTWALYLLHRLGLKVDAIAAEAVVKMEDNCSLVLLRDLDSEGRVIGPNLDWTSVIARVEDPSAPSGSDWLLSYEFAHRGWASPAAFVALPNWKELLELGVEFYESPPRLSAARAGKNSGELAIERGVGAAEPSVSVGELQDPEAEDSDEDLPKDDEDGDEGDIEECSEDGDLDEVELLSFRGADRY